MSIWKLQSNILPQVHAEIKQAAQQVLVGAGELFKKSAYSQCPVSNIRTPGYVHLRDTINYEVDAESTFYQQWVIFFVVKEYAQFVNDGTSRMPPRPFFTNGVLFMGDQIDSIVRKAFVEIRAGRAGYLK